MKLKRKIIQIDDEKCDGCGQCAIACAEGAIRIVDGKARVISDNLCDGLGACIGECPQGALRIIEREASAFDEAAVEEHLKAGKSPAKPVMECGCPSSQIRTFAPAPSSPKQAHSAAATGSALTHWPIQIRLIQPTAPFLKGADLLVLADCAAVAHVSLHQDLLKGRIVMMGCPKFDDAQAYIDRFAEIFRTAGIKSITTVYMEVPCCAGLPFIIQKALEKSVTDIPVTSIKLSSRGEVLEGRVK
jgi:Fe-S-cluster-containing hydrogenase component 2